MIGAGTAGCVLARRLSDEGASVLLVESGPDTPPGRVPGDIRDLYPRSYYNQSYMWSGLRADQSGDGTGKKSPFTQARVMGGGSSLMGMVALRGLPSDYDSWDVPGWSWADVLPYFRRLEADREFQGSLHGTEGPVCIRRHMPADWPPFCQVVGSVVARLGWASLADMNDDPADGYGPLPLSATLAARVSAATAYLDAPTRSRANLTISCNTTVGNLDLDGDRCKGAWAYSEAGCVRYRARRTVLCAGAIFSPVILMRSGVGPAEHLRSLGVPVRVNLPGVGQNLQNHPIVYLAAHLQKAARQPPWLRPTFATALRFSSRVEGGSSGELQMLVLNRSSWEGVGAAVGALGVCLMQPRSRGEVRLAGAGLETQPDVRFRMLTVSSDLERLLVGFGTACDVMSDAEVRTLRHEVFAAGYSGVVRRLNRPGLASSVLSRVLSSLLDGPPTLRRELLRWGIAAGDVGEARLCDTAWRLATVRSRSFGTYHPVGTCSMGSEDDPEAVTRPDGEVLGVQGLSVIDASIIPMIPRANTNVPVLMIAERCADLVLARDK